MSVANSTRRIKPASCFINSIILQLYTFTDIIATIC
jgi:hypothetical protein